MPTTLARALLALSLCSAPAFADSITKTNEPAAPSYELSAGGYHDSRSLLITGENPEGLTQYAGVGHEGLSLEGAAYPLRHRHANGWVSSAGASFSFRRSVGADVTFDDGEGLYDLAVAQTALDAAAHYRLGAGRITVDAEVGAGRQRYEFSDAPLSFEVPSTSLTYVSAGARLGVDVFRGVTLAGGARVMAGMGDNGEMTTFEWYGSGEATGVGYDVSLTVPLPKGTFVRARVATSKLTTKFDGVGVITEMEGAVQSTDSTTSAGVSIGIRR